VDIVGRPNLRSQIATSRSDLIRPEVEKECPHAGGVHDQERDSRSRDDAPRAGFALAVNRSIRELALLKRLHGPGRWRKLKGEAIVELPDGAVVAAELHWYEAHGIGRRGMKIKKLLI